MNYFNALWKKQFLPRINCEMKVKRSW